MRRIEVTAGWLAARAIEPGDVVALLMKNSAAFIELTFATSHLGAVSLPINYRLAADEVGYILDNSQAKLLICDAEFARHGAGSCRRGGLRRHAGAERQHAPRPVSASRPRCTRRGPTICFA